MGKMGRINILLRLINFLYETKQSIDWLCIGHRNLHQKFSFIFCNTEAENITLPFGHADGRNDLYRSFFSTKNVLHINSLLKQDLSFNLRGHFELKSSFATKKSYKIYVWYFF